MAALKPPSGRSPAKKKTTARKKPASTRARLTAARARKKAVTDTAVTAGELLGAGAMWSGVSAWRNTKGQDLKLFKTVDTRIVAGLAGLVAGLWWPKAKWSEHAVNLSIGTLGSWVHEYSYEMGSKWAGKAAPATTSASGIVVGDVVGDYDDDEAEGYDDETEGMDEVGLFGRRARLARIERKLARLKNRRARIASKLAARGRLPAGHEAGPGPQMITVPAGAVRPGYLARMQ